MHTVRLVVYANFQPLALSVGAVFEYANLSYGRAAYDFKIVSEKAGSVLSSQGFAVSTGRLEDSTCNTLIVAGENTCCLPSAKLLDDVREVATRAQRVASVCTGAFVLAAAGLLEGKNATTHWYHARSFRKQYSNVTLDEDRIFIIDGRIWTSAGMTAGVDLALAMVEKDLGVETARVVARKLVLHHRRGGGQSQFSTFLDLDAKSERVRAVLSYARENLHRELTVESLAEVSGVSPRQFSRLFQSETGESPGKAVERLRVEAARWMMESNPQPIEVIARETGFGNRERMRQAFLRAFGQSPQAMQRAVASARSAV